MVSSAESVGSGEARASWSPVPLETSGTFLFVAKKSSYKINVQALQRLVNSILECVASILAGVECWGRHAEEALFLWMDTCWGFGPARVRQASYPLLCSRQQASYLVCSRHRTDVSCLSPLLIQTPLAFPCAQTIGPAWLP